MYFNEKEKAHTFISENLMAIIMPMGEIEKIDIEERHQGPDFRNITEEPKILEFRPAKAKARKAKKAKTA